MTLAQTLFVPLSASALHLRFDGGDDVAVFVLFRVFLSQSPVDLYEVFKGLPRLDITHRFAEHPPGRFVGNARFLPQPASRNSLLVVQDEVDGVEPPSACPCWASRALCRRSVRRSYRNVYSGRPSPVSGLCKP